MAALRAVLIAIVVVAALVAVPISWVTPRFAVSIVRRACRVLLALLGVHVCTEGAPAPGLLVANHVSWLDVMIVLTTQPVCFLAKTEVGAWPLIASLARSQGTIFVDRGRRRCIPAVNEAMAERLASGRTVLLFPEGTTHDGSRRGRFHTSHLACLRSLFARAPATSGAVVQPVALAYSDPVAAWIGDDTLLSHLWRVLQRPGITCALRFGPSITIERGYDRKALGRILGSEIDALLSLDARHPTPSRGRGATLLPGWLGARRFRQAEALGYAGSLSCRSAEPPDVRGPDATMKSP